jgi:putative oxidoreductase
MKRVLLIAGQLILAGIFIYAGYAKLREPWPQFAVSISTFKLVPDTWLEPMAKWVPWAELVLGLAVLSGILLRWSALVASLVLTLFFAVLIRSYALGIDVDCGCFGSGEAHLGPLRLAEEAVMLALAVGVTVAAFRRGRKATGTPRVA